MTYAHWWARVVQAQTEQADLPPQRVSALRKDGQATMALKAMPGIGAEIVLTVRRGAAQDAPVPLSRAGGTGRRDC